MKRGSALYLYCVLLSSRRPRLSGRAPSLPGASPPRLVPAPGGLWLVVADAPLERFGETALEKGMRDLSWVTRCAVAHQGVIERGGCSR